jgi:ribonuclease BN (tRNA processing enzyme)
MHLKTIFLISIISLCQSGCMAADKKSCLNVKLQVLGSGGPEINDGLASSSYLIWIDGKAKVMVDAGGGSSLNFEKSGASFNDLEAILLTHLHVDHSVALPVYIKAGYFTNRESTLAIFGPIAGGGFPSTTEFVAALFSDQQKSVYPYLSDNYRQQSSTDFLIKASSVDPNNKVWKTNITDNISLQAINVIHGAIPAVAWRVNLYGCSLTFSGDMNGASGNLDILAKNTNLLIANNAIPENAHPIAQRLHMMPSRIAEIARNAAPGKILLSHFMRRTVDKKKQTISMIKKSYSGHIILAQDLDLISLN